MYHGASCGFVEIKSAKTCVVTYATAAENAVNECNKMTYLVWAYQCLIYIYTYACYKEGYSSRW